MFTLPEVPEMEHEKWRVISWSFVSVAVKGFFQRVKKSCEIHILVNEQESF